ncbi:MAG: hypothetical protein AB7T06_36140 [Kofleriaceae bacterium]
MQRVRVLVITWAVGCLCGLLGLVGRTADAHIAPSVDDNNRYLKVTPSADRLRLAYTVFFGEVPGRQMRPSLDANKDGILSEDEGAAFGAKLSREVADGIELTVDGTVHPIRWETVAVGLGTPDVSAGSFSVDMIAYVCLPGGPRHTLLLRDRFRVPKPGETEVKVEDALGITIEHARVGPFDDPTHDYKLVGPGGPLMDDGLDAAFVVTDKAPRGDQACASRAPASDRGSVALWIALAIAGALAITIAVLVLRRARRR